MQNRTEKKNGFWSFYKSHMVGMVVVCAALVIASVAATKNFTAYTVISGVIPFLLPVISWFANGRKGK